MRRNSLLRALIDTNVLFSGLSSRDGSPFEILERWRAAEFELLVTDEIVAEYRRVLARPSFKSRLSSSQRVLDAFFSQLQAQALVVSSSSDVPVQCRDPKDEMFLSATIAAGVEFLITSDDVLLSLAGDPRLGNLRILQPRAFLDILLAND